MSNDIRFSSQPGRPTLEELDANASHRASEAAARQAQLDAAKERFLKSGGSITVVPSGVQAIDTAAKEPRGTELRRRITTSATVGKERRAQGGE